MGTRFADFLSGLSDFLGQGNLPIGTPAGIQALAQHLSVDDAFRDDLASMLRVVCAAEPAISYLELLGLLLVATVGKGHADQLSGDPACEADVRTIFNFVVEMRRAGKSDLESLEPTSESYPHHEFLGKDSAEVAAQELWQADEVAYAPPAITNVQRPSRGRAETHAGLARALALAADDEFPGEAAPNGLAEPTLPSPVQTLPRTAVADPALLLSRAPERPTWSFTWSVTLCGVLLGLLLGVFLQRRCTLRAETREAPAPLAAAVPDPAPLPPVSSQKNVLRAGYRGSTGPLMAEQASRRMRLPSGNPITSANDLARAPHDAVHPMTTARPSPNLAVAGAASLLGASAGHAAVASAAASPKVSEVVLNTRADSGMASLGRDQRAGRVLLGSAGIMAANLVSSPAPPYPAQASAAQVQGEVIVEAIVGRDGDVIQTRVVSGPPMLRDAALRAVGRWRYRPYQVDGEATEIATTARLDFRLDP